MENIYIPGYGTFTSNFNVEEHIYDYQGEPWEYDHQEFMRETIEEQGGKMPGINAGMKFSEEHRKAISDSLRGRKIGPMSEEHKKKISDALKGRVLGTKVPVSKEERLKRSVRAKAWWDANKGKERNCRRTKIVVDGKVINSVKEAAELYKISRQTVYNRLYSDKFNWNFF